MPLDRRRFLALAGAAAAALPFPATATQSPRRYAACGADDTGQSFVAAFDETGCIRFRTPLPARGHAVAVHPLRAELVVFPRRPGLSLHAIDTTTGGAIREIGVREDRRYFGHGFFSPDGARLYATENDLAAGRGVLGIYDPADGYRRIGEIPTHGIGPHQAIPMPDGKTLAVANGGIRTHPDFGRAKLDIPAMQPSLAFVDAASGRLEHRFAPPQRLHRLSIRHVAVNRAGTVAVAMAYEGGIRDRVPLVALAKPGAPLRLLETDPLQQRMRHYTGAVRFDSSGRTIAVSAPRGNVIGLWDAETGAMAGAIPAFDSSGIAPAGVSGRFIVTGGDGAIRLGSAAGVTTVRPPRPGQHWDNHAEPLAG